MSRPEVVKRIWEYVRSHSLQDPANRKYIQCDAKLQAVFRKKRVDCFSMNRLLTSHMGAQDEVATNSKVEEDSDGSSETREETLAASDRENEARQRLFLLLGRDADLTRVLLCCRRLFSSNSCEFPP